MNHRAGRCLGLAGVAASVLLAGCATKWAKPGATAAEFDGMKAVCTSRAYQQVPPFFQPVQISSGYYTPIQTSCSGYGFAASCFQTGGQYIPPAFMSVDRNEGARAANVRACFYENGWQPVKDNY